MDTLATHGRTLVGTAGFGAIGDELFWDFHTVAQDDLGNLMTRQDGRTYELDCRTCAVYVVDDVAARQGRRHDGTERTRS